MGLGRFTHWLWPGTAARVASHELPATALTGASFPDFPSGFREPDTVTFSSAAAGGSGGPGTSGAAAGSAGSTGSTTWSSCRPTAAGACPGQTPTTPTGPSAGWSRRRRRCRRTVIPRPASPSSCPATAAAAPSCPGRPRAGSWALALSPTDASLTELEFFGFMTTLAYGFMDHKLQPYSAYPLNGLANGLPS
ncbi:hypothetical protein ACQ4PT_013693 [Festuca glaucescens]